MPIMPIIQSKMICRKTKIKDENMMDGNGKIYETKQKELPSYKRCKQRALYSSIELRCTLQDPQAVCSRKLEQMH